jgi:hypothetical protein
MNTVIAENEIKDQDGCVTLRRELSKGGPVQFGLSLIWGFGDVPKLEPFTYFVDDGWLKAQVHAGEVFWVRYNRNTDPHKITLYPQIVVDGQKRVNTQDPKEYTV